MQKTWVQSLGRDDPLEEETAIHSRALVMKNPMDWGAWWAPVLRVAKSWTQLSTHIAAPNSLRFPRSRQKPVTKRGVQNGKEREGNTHNTAHWCPSFIFNCYQREVLGVTHTTLPNSPCLSHVQTRLRPWCTTKIQLAPQVKKGSLRTQRDLSKAIIFLLSRMLAIFKQAGKHSYASSERQIPEW